MTLSSNNELADLIGSISVDIRVVAFDDVSQIYRLYKNKVTLEMAQIEAIYYIIWAHMPMSLHKFAFIKFIDIITATTTSTLLVLTTTKYFQVYHQ